MKRSSSLYPKRKPRHSFLYTSAELSRRSIKAFSEIYTRNSFLPLIHWHSYRYDWARCKSYDLCSRASEEYPPNTLPAMCSHNYNVYFVFFCKFYYCFMRNTHKHTAFNAFETSQLLETKSFNLFLSSLFQIFIHLIYRHMRHIPTCCFNHIIKNMNNI